jgi:hypothetical protein
MSKDSTLAGALRRTPFLFARGGRFLNTSSFRPWRGDRVADCARLEIVCTPQGYRGFESPPLRHHPHPQDARLGRHEAGDEKPWRGFDGRTPANAGRPEMATQSPPLRHLLPKTNFSFCWKPIPRPRRSVGLSTCRSRGRVLCPEGYKPPRGSAGCLPEAARQQEPCTPAVLADQAGTD